MSIFKGLIFKLFAPSVWSFCIVATLHKATVISHLDYCNNELVYLSASMLVSLQAVPQTVIGVNLLNTKSGLLFPSNGGLGYLDQPSG